MTATRGFGNPLRTYGSSAGVSDAQLARRANEAPLTPWNDFIRNTFRWEPGEHIGLIGPTGSGKTTMLDHLLPLHKYVVVFATKPRDASMDALIHQGYLKLERWRKLDPDDYPRRVLWPDARRMDSVVIQRQAFKDAFDRIYIEGGWTVAIDELWVFDNMLKLEWEVRQYLLQARSLDISVLAGFQRPAWVPREVYGSCTHLFFWRVNDRQDLQNLSGIGARSSDVIADVVANLEPFQCLYINTRTGKMARTRCPELPTVEGR